jgi:thermostable 8-oxoguanine DNA glycosylase
MAMGAPNREAVRIIENLCGYGYQAPAASDFQGRLRRNVHGIDRRSSKADAWNATLIAILTTQQPSGPGSKPAQALHSKTLTWGKVKRDPRIIYREISGFRFNDTKRRQLRSARTWLDRNWPEVKSFQTELDTFGPDDESRYEAELEAAELLANANTGILGVGPKQARNFWQYLGYTVWTIPLDSRVQKILQAPPFSMTWGNKGLTKAAYCRIEEQVGELCRAVTTTKVYPVLLDSVLFNMQGLMRDLAGFPNRDRHGF